MTTHRKLEILFAADAPEERAPVVRCFSQGRLESRTEAMDVWSAGSHRSAHALPNVKPSDHGPPPFKNVVASAMARDGSKEAPFGVVAHGPDQLTALVALERMVAACLIQQIAQEELLDPNRP